MGRLQAEEMSQMLPMEQALHWHLQYNHYPPVHSIFIPVAMEAIEKANDEDYDSIIKMPNGASLSVEKIIEGLHLESWLEVEDE